MQQITLGILAHVDAGKTTLSEAMLYTAGAIQKLGRVDKRDSFLDTDALERRRGITIFSKQARLTWKDTAFTLLDTPGHVDFSAETERTLQVLDYAVLVISGTDGVQSHTKTLWELLQKYGVPTFVFVNKMDLDGSDKEVLLHALQTHLSDRCVDFDSPGSEEFLEHIALCDDALMDSLAQNGTLSDGEITAAVQQRKVFPCVFGAALKVKGVGALLDRLCRFTAPPEYPAAFGAKVFKIAEDSHGARLTFLKVTGGVLRVKEVLQSDKNGDNEKVNQIRLYSGDKYTLTDSAPAGTVCAVTGITFAAAGDGLGAEKNTASPLLQPVLTYTLQTPDGADAHTVLQKMRLLEAEDPQLKVSWSETLGEIQVQLMGEVQREVLQSMAQERFGLHLEFGKGNIIYKETIQNETEGVGHFEPLRHYAEVHLLLKPLPRGSGLRISADCREEVLDKNWQRLIVTHLFEKTHRGVLTGAPVTDMELILKSGRAHPKHTEGGDFRQATYRAVRQGLRSAESVLLEPMYAFSLEIPGDSVGRAMADIQKMSGTFAPPELLGDRAVICGRAPVSEMQEYHREVVAYTRGTGRLACTFDGYDVCHNADEVIASVGYDCDADTANTADSVFCAHGAGYTVKWDEVKSHMHLPSVLSRKSDTPVAGDITLPVIRNNKDIFASDKELMQIFERTYGAVRKPASPSEQRVYDYNKPAPEKQHVRKKAPQYDGKEYLLVDGYNVIFAWEHLRALSESSIDGARNALINILCNYRGYQKCEVILVFDAYKVKGDREVEEVNGIHIVYTKEAETADMYIEKVSHQLARNNKVRVVTSDALEQLIILGGGALRVSSRAFLQEVRAAEEDIRRIIEEHS